ncbi:peptidase M16 family protein [Pedobacter agri]|uniref:Insulinase family protein n=1 Tax=Pedobacter agri TaxID=454586 RepID=A0A9X3DGA3_9SPHI|nr:insulinase family protein [Pedobacter agri]MCX3266752.1 insulinase family protein [Pedobacter agri]
MNTIKTILLSLLGLTFSISVSAQSFKEPVAFKLKNGMNIIISENNRSPKAYASFTLDNKSFENKKDGIVEMLNAVLNEGLGKNADFLFNDNSGKLATSTAEFDEKLTDMASKLQHIEIDQQTFNTAKAKLLTSIKLQDYDYDQTVNETSIGNLTFADVKSFYNEISPEKTYLTIAGNVELNAAKASAKKAFGNWHNQNIRKNIAPLAR